MRAQHLTPQSEGVAVSQSEEKPFEVEVDQPAPARSSALNLASIGAASAVAPQPSTDGEGFRYTAGGEPEPKPLVSGTLGMVLGIISLMAATGAGLTSGLVQAGLVVLALVSGLVVGKYAVEAPAFAAGKPLVQGSWLTLASAGAVHLGNLAAVLPPGLGCSLAVAGCALCCLLAGLPFARPSRK
jgi:hypothetical protein